MSLEKNWVLQVDSAVYKFFKKIPRHDAESILFAIESLSDDPFYGDVQKMKGEKHTWRRRIGSYRIFYELIPTEKVIYVVSAERRTSKTY
ncbi:MAG: type II toxin-antitoxin system RelE/ParE family toxin [Candidatus Harrisonbacteria bacterium]|nr:type II toxin-antitoxin system RelE/ParE family toxin [Candidatus Harrisonbacteria bacterium]